MANRTLECLIVAKPEEAAARLIYAFDVARGNKNAVAQILGVYPLTLTRWVNRLGLGYDLARLYKMRGYHDGYNNVGAPTANRKYNIRIPNEQPPEYRKSMKRFRMPVRFDELDPSLADESSVDAWLDF